MPIIRCPHCDDRVEIDDDWYGRRINCPSCDQTFTPKRSGRSDDRDEDERPSRRRASDDDDRDRDDSPRSRRRSKYDDDGPPKKKGSAVLWVVLILVVLFVVLPCGGCIGFMVWGMNAKESFNGPWSDASVGPGGEVTASFPKTPSNKYLNVSGSTTTDVKGWSNLNDADSPLDVEMAIGYVEYPAGTVAPLEKGYSDIRRAVEDTLIDNPVVRPQVLKEGSTTVNGFPAKEATYTEETGGYTLRVIHLTDRPPGSNVRLVVVFAGGTNMKPEDKQKFLNSVRISGKK